MDPTAGTEALLPRTYRVLTLGCKLNQFDSASIAGELRLRGFREANVGERVGVLVVNTCTVTGKADREARQLARRGRREQPGCRLLVTGCYAERDREGLAAEAAIDEIVGHSDRARLPALLDRIAEEAAPLEGEIACLEAARASEAGPLHFGDRTRAFLKVQEGCDLTCSYCIIPKVRGASRSIAPERLEAALEELTERGYREVVLTGVNTGDYGKDLTPRTTLAELLRRLLRTRGLGRVRLNSLEPRSVTGEIVALLAGEARLARHLQIPLQSGSDPTLTRMHRNYRTAAYRRTLDTLRERIPGIGLGADVIAGFPGETREEFEETHRFIASSPLNYLHVFSYSDRPGTPASGMESHVSPQEIQERSARLRTLGAALGHSFRRRFVGSTLEVLVLRRRLPDGRRRALSDNFIEMALDAGTGGAAGRLLSARVHQADAHETLATPVGAAERAVSVSPDGPAFRPTTSAPIEQIRTI